MQSTPLSFPQFSYQLHPTLRSNKTVFVFQQKGKVNKENCLKWLASLTCFTGKDDSIGSTLACRSSNSSLNPDNRYFII